MSSALLKAIAAQPEEDAPRLVYADALLEQADPLGEFISVQCEAARLPPGSPRRVPLELRATQLLEAHRAAWSPLGLDWQFERGFPSALQVHVSALRRHAVALDALPTLRDLEVRFTSAAPADVEGLLRLPLLRKLRALRFNWHTPRQLAVDLLFEPWVAQLDLLQLSWVMLPTDVWQALGRAGSPARQLSHLDLMLADARDESLRLLDPAPWARLKWLRLSNGRLGTRGCELLAQVGLFPALEHLDASWNRLGKQGAAALARAPLAQQLRSLNLSHCQVGDEGCAALADARPARLLSLWLQNSRVTTAGTELLRAALPSTRIWT